jgi:cell division protein FtsW
MDRLENGQARRREELVGSYDGPLLCLVLALAAIGVVMVASSSLAVAENLGVGPFHFLQRHLVFLAIGTACAVLVARTELRWLERHSSNLLVLSVLLLMAVLIPGIGRTVNGAQRWINLGFIGFQAVEAVKLLLVVWLSAYMVKYREQLHSQLWGALKPLLVLACLCGLLLLQPDFGSSVLLAAITFCMLWVGGARIAHLAAPALIGLAGMAALAVFEPYRWARLVAFLNPWNDPFGDGYQLSQALIAVGRGEGAGVGLGASVQKLFYLPEAHTDFIFAVIAEETGFIGVSLLICLFALLAWRAFWLGLRAQDMGRSFAAHCAFGSGLWISLQALVSMGVNMGLLPTKGLTLPLISSGGSSVIMSCAAIGLLLRVGYEAERARRQYGRLRGEDMLDPGELVARLREQRRAEVAPALQQPSPVFAPAPVRGRVEPRLGALP